MIGNIIFWVVIQFESRGAQISPAWKILQNNLLLLPYMTAGMVLSALQVCHFYLQATVVNMAIEGKEMVFHLKSTDSGWCHQIHNGSAGLNTSSEYLWRKDWEAIVKKHLLQSVRNTFFLCHFHILMFIKILFFFTTVC